MTQESISNAQLNAFIDRQLDATERVEILAAVQQDNNLSQELAELSQLKEWVRFTYQQPPQPAIAAKSIFPLQAVQGIAASLLLGLGVIGGWWAHTPVPGPSFHELARFESIPAASEKVLMHISKMDETKITTALDKAEQLLRASREKNRPLQLEIVANAEGLGLLRQGSPFSGRVQAISRQHDNVAFLACGIAMENVRLKEGREAELLPEARKIDAALEQILRRLKQGWTYVKS